MRLDFVLPAGTNSFIKMLHRQIEQQAASRPDLDVRVATIEGFNPDSLARALQELQGRTHGVGVIALDHPTVREAIRSLAASGAKVVTIASDILHVPRIAYVGIDNRAAGGWPAICSAGCSVPAAPARSRCSPARSPIAATRNARWASATS